MDAARSDAISFFFIQVFPFYRFLAGTCLWGWYLDAPDETVADNAAPVNGIELYDGSYLDLDGEYASGVGRSQLSTPCLLLLCLVGSFYNKSE